MSLWAGLCLCWLAAFDLLTGLSQEGYIGYPTGSGSENIEIVSSVRREITTNEEKTNSIDGGKRIKRALYGLLGLALKGFETAKKLLRGTHHLYTVTSTRKIYVKKGDYRTALANFRSAHLDNVDEFELPGGVKGKIGESGDRIITIQTVGESGHPTMKIIRQSSDGSEQIDVIVYVKTKKKKSPEETKKKESPE